MFPFPRELYIYIADLDQEAWFKLYLCDKWFSEYASSDDGRRRFIELFLICERTPDKTQYLLFGKLNSVYDQPAQIHVDGTQSWCQNDNYHRDNEPALIDPNGTKYYYQHGKCHRDNDLPAIDCVNGTQFWYQYGVWYRDNDKPNFIDYRGVQHWFQNNQLHRDNDLPAVIGPNGTQEYWVNGVKIK